MNRVFKLFETHLVILAGIFLFHSCNGASTDKREKKSVVVEMVTNQGVIEITLNAEKAPQSVQNFLEYVDQGFYNGTVFHRVISTFMIQGGGFDVKMEQKTTRAPIKNEADNGLKNIKGTVAMARTGVVDSATSQFFINVVDNNFLDHREKSTQGYGYAVFGQVTKGMDVVDKIKSMPTANKGMHQNVPVTPVIIESLKRK